MSRATHSVAIPEQVAEVLSNHLLRADRQEDLCFAFWRPSRGRSRATALVEQIILPRAGERTVHGNVSFEPDFFQRAMAEAAKSGAGLALLHSHPHGHGWQDMSPDDIVAETKIAPATFGATGLPLLGATLAGDRSWSARFWERKGPRAYDRNCSATVRIVGDQLRVTFMNKLAPVPRTGTHQIRTIAAWGDESHANLVRLRVGVIGAGSVGGMVATSLARTGFEDIMVMDFDHVEEHNLDRANYATRKDVGRLKVDVLAEHLETCATAENFHVERIPAAVYEEVGFRAALDCDILFSCVDRPWGRYALNVIAYAHLIPVYDGGIAVRVNRHSKLVAADWRAHTAAPGRRCLQCMGQYDPSFVQVEREGHLDDPAYIAGLPKTHALKARENVFVFSMACASLQTLQMLSHTIAPLGRSNPGEQRYHFVGGHLAEPVFEPCHRNCQFPGLLAKGDHSGIDPTGDRPKPKVH